MITKTDFSKYAFCTRYWDQFYPADRRPYWDTDPSGSAQRIFLSAVFYPDWEHFRPAAEKALEAAQVEYSGYKDAFVQRTYSVPISGEPHFLLEKNGLWKGFTIWVNALCPDEQQFKLTLSQAQDEIANHGKPVVGATLDSLYKPLPLLRYPSAWCQDDPSTIGGTFNK